MKAPTAPRIDAAKTETAEIRAALPRIGRQLPVLVELEDRDRERRRRSREGRCTGRPGSASSNRIPRVASVGGARRAGGDPAEGAQQGRRSSSFSQYLHSGASLPGRGLRVNRTRPPWTRPAPRALWRHGRSEPPLGRYRPRRRRATRPRRRRSSTAWPRILGIAARHGGQPGGDPVQPDGRLLPGKARRLRDIRALRLDQPGVLPDHLRHGAVRAPALTLIAQVKGRGRRGADELLHEPDRGHPRRPRPAVLTLARAWSLARPVLLLLNTPPDVLGPGPDLPAHRLRRHALRVRRTSCSSRPSPPSGTP
ncbi:MAG: hypothetical protein M0C28_22615 [Candidatus Moduliflexus flocculans]|nr:hypothetical protein [Candidatus Moduliflexus flocculans]